MDKRAIKSILYEQVARMGKCFSSPKRLEILNLLAQSEKSVEMLAIEANIDIRLASAHLRALRWQPGLRFLPPYHDDSAYIAALKAAIAP